MIKDTKTIAVIGLGRFGESVALTLHELGHEVIGIDENEEVVQSFGSILTHVVKADTTKKETLHELGIQNCDAAVVAIGSNIEASIVTTLLLKELGVPYILAKATNHLHGKVLAKLGIDKIVFPEKDMGARSAFHLLSTSIVDYLHISPELCLVEVNTPVMFIGSTISSIRFREKYNVTVAAVRRSNQMIVPPSSQEILEEGDILFLIGEKNAVNQLQFLV